jgi:small subunit ribosomal protein S17
MARTITGTVVSDKVDKTIVISVAVRKTHPLYKKQYTVNTKFMAHDEKNKANVGDRVSIVECRPISARKRFALSKVLDHANVRFEEKDATADVLQEQPEAKSLKPKAAASKKAAKETEGSNQ